MSRKVATIEWKKRHYHNTYIGPQSFTEPHVCVHDSEHEGGAFGVDIRRFFSEWTPADLDHENAYDGPDVAAMARELYERQADAKRAAVEAERVRVREEKRARTRRNLSTIPRVSDGIALAVHEDSEGPTAEPERENS